MCVQHGKPTAVGSILKVRLGDMSGQTLDEQTISLSGVGVTLSLEDGRSLIIEANAIVRIEPESETPQNIFVRGEVRSGQREVTLTSTANVKWGGVLGLTVRVGGAHICFAPYVWGWCSALIHLLVVVVQVLGACRGVRLRNAERPGRRNAP